MKYVRIRQDSLTVQFDDRLCTLKIPVSFVAQESAEPTFEMMGKRRYRSERSSLDSEYGAWTE